MIMSYLRFISELPSGKQSSVYVYPGEKGIINMGRLRFIDKEQIEQAETEEDCFLNIPYNEMTDLLKTRTFDEIKQILIQRLELNSEEAEVVCQEIMKDYQDGFWNKMAGIE